jgi:hypothetical protein
VSISAVTGAVSCPLNWRLFVPECWDHACVTIPEAAAAIRARRERAAIPAEARHREKWRLALDMLDELAGWELAPPVVGADFGYGAAAEFRDGLPARGWAYGMQVEGELTAYPAGAVPEVKPSLTGSPSAAALPQQAGRPG